jgi:hypothetical protein
MNGLVLVVSLLVVPGWCRGPTLDKTGTTGSPTGATGAEALEKQEPAGAGSCSAERAGFELGLSPLQCRISSMATNAGIIHDLRFLRVAQPGPGILR